MNEKLTVQEVIQNFDKIQFRRLDELLPGWAMPIPVLLLFLVYFLAIYYRQPDTLKKMFHTTLKLPNVIMSIFWWTFGLSITLWILCSAVGVGVSYYVAEFNGGEPIQNAALSILLLGMGLLLIALTFLLLFFLIPLYFLILFIATIIMHVRRPLLFIPSVVVGGICLIYGAVLAAVPNFRNWEMVMVAILGVAAFYSALMYGRDARTANPAWAIFLNGLRWCVYLLVALIFLKPAIPITETRETNRSILTIFNDVTASMDRTDSLPGEKKTKTTTRQDLVQGFFQHSWKPDPKYKELDLPEVPKNKALTLVQHLQRKSPVHLYRFGEDLDKRTAYKFPEGNEFMTWNTKDWNTWLRPDPKKAELDKDAVKDADKAEVELAKLQLLLASLRNGTNINQSLLSGLKNESGSDIQAIIVTSDGKNTIESSETFRELTDLTKNATKPVVIFTLGVGDYAAPVTLFVNQPLAPQQARPDDPMEVRVSVSGDQLAGKEVTVYLDIVKGTGNTEEDFVADKKFSTFVAVKQQEQEDLILKGKVNPADLPIIYKAGKISIPQKVILKGGKAPTDLKPFKINVRKLLDINPKSDSEDDRVTGHWQFNARVEKLKEENYDKPEHISEPVYTLIQKRPLRVLLFAGGPSREYRFVRTLFYREVLAKKMDLAIYLQSGSEKNVSQDVRKEALLTRFPNRIGKNNTSEKYASLSEFDVIIAFDPDWRKLTATQLTNLERWVGGVDAGSLVFVAGPVNSYQLARAAKTEVKRIIEMCPVVLKDSRVFTIQGLDHDFTRPYELGFEPGAEAYEFLKLSEDETRPFQSWQEFFWEPYVKILSDKAIKGKYPAKWYTRKANGEFQEIGDALVSLDGGGTFLQKYFGQLNDKLFVAYRAGTTVGEIDGKEYTLPYFEVPRDQPKTTGSIPVNGFFSYYPVEEIKPGTLVLATFQGPPKSRIQLISGEEIGQPFIASMKYSSGKCIYIGSGELWRLRGYKEDWHQRFWLKLARFAAGNNLAKLNNNGMILMKRVAPAGYVPIEAQVLGANELPLDKNIKPIVEVREFGKDKKLAEFELAASVGVSGWNGFFTGLFPAKEAKKYTLKIPVPGTNNSLYHDIEIYKEDPERDEPKQDHDFLIALASNADMVVDRIPVAERSKFLNMLPVDKSTGERKLFFEIKRPEDAESFGKLIEQTIEKRKPIVENTITSWISVWDVGFWEAREIGHFSVTEEDVKELEEKEKEVDSFSELPKRVAKEFRDKKVELSESLQLTELVKGSQWELLDVEKERYYLVTYRHTKLRIVEVQTVTSGALYLFGLSLLGYFGFVAFFYFLLFDRAWTSLIFTGSMVWLSIIGTYIVLQMSFSHGTEWDKVPMYITGYSFLLFLPTGLALIIFGILTIMQQFRLAIITFLLAALYVAVLVWCNSHFNPNWEVMLINASILQSAIILLLSTEWLCRKLLRLA